MPAYISEIDYFGDSSEEFVEVAVPAGTDVSGYTLVFYQADGTIYNTFSLGNYATTIAGKDVYVLDDGTAGFSNGDPMGNFYPDDAVALVDGSGTVLQFISWDGNTVTATEGAANGLTSSESGTQTGSLQSDDGGTSYFVQGTPNPGTIPACYAPGTLIDTPTGCRAVEDLREGDLVTTLDGQPQQVLWVWNDVQCLESQKDGSLPIFVRAGALGDGVPTRDMLVSAQHRILVGAHGQVAGLAEAACFVPAKALTRLPGVRPFRRRTKLRWVHFACARHEVVVANGCLSESLYLGPMVVQALTHRQRAALRLRFGPSPVGAALNGPLARPTLTVKQARQALCEMGRVQQRRQAPDGPKGLSSMRGTRIPLG